LWLLRVVMYWVAHSCNDVTYTINKYNVRIADARYHIANDVWPDAYCVIALWRITVMLLVRPRSTIDTATSRTTGIWEVESEAIRYFLPVTPNNPDRSWPPLPHSLLFNCYWGSFPEGGQGIKLTTHFHLVLKLQTSKLQAVSTSPISLDGVDKDNFSCFITWLLVICT